MVVLILYPDVVLGEVVMCVETDGTRIGLIVFPVHLLLNLLTLNSSSGEQCVSL